MEIVLQTARTYLRKMTFEDADDLLQIFSDPQAMRFYPSTKTRDETVEWISRNLDRYKTYGFGMYMVVLKDSGCVAGTCGLVMQQIDQKQEVEIGYLFLRKYWGRGLATEAAAACRDYGRQLGFSRLVSLIDPDNWASRRVAEKNGLALETYVYLWDRRLCLYSLSVSPTS